MTESFIGFELAEKQNPKTHIWRVKVKDDGLELGEIKWLGRWRKYCFFPNNQTVFEEHCLRDISDFIEAQTFEHKHPDGLTYTTKITF